MAANVRTVSWAKLSTAAAQGFGPWGSTPPSLEWPRFMRLLWWKGIDAAGPEATLCPACDVAFQRFDGIAVDPPHEWLTEIRREIALSGLRTPDTPQLGTSPEVGQLTVQLAQELAATEDGASLRKGFTEHGENYGLAAATILLTGDDSTHTPALRRRAADLLAVWEAPCATGYLVEAMRNIDYLTTAAWKLEKRGDRNALPAAADELADLLRVRHHYPPAGDPPFPKSMSASYQVRTAHPGISPRDAAIVNRAWVFMPDLQGLVSHLGGKDLGRRALYEVYTHSLFVDDPITAAMKVGDSQDPSDVDLIALGLAVREHISDEDIAFLVRQQSATGWWAMDRFCRTAGELKSYVADYVRSELANIAKPSDESLRKLERRYGRLVDLNRRVAPAAAVTETASAPVEALPAYLRSEALLSMASPDIFRRNPFRVTGLHVTATPREMAKQADKLKMFEKLGTPPAPASLGLPLDPPPNSEAVREAMQRLQDPEKRLIDEVFWIWPTPGASDEALDRFDGGDAKAAEDIWDASDGPNRDIACHNLAVLEHARLLESDSTPVPAWKLVLGRWQWVLKQEAFWCRIDARIRELDDPRLTTDTARRLRHTLPQALLTINARLAVQAAERGDFDCARRQRYIMLSSDFEQDVISEALSSAVSSVRDRLQTLCKAAGADSDADPAHADQVVDRLLEQARAPLQVLETILPRANALRTGALDEVALKALGCQIVFGNKTENWQVCARLLGGIMAIAVSESARGRIQQSIDTVEGNKTATTCWFCGNGKAEASHAAEVKMYGNVKRTPTWQGVEVTWNHGTVPVPRCADCKARHTSPPPTAPIALGCLGSFIGFLVMIALEQGPVFEPRGAVAGLVIILASIVGGSVAFSRRKKAILGVQGKGAKAEGERVNYPVILEKKKQGWMFGERPV